MSRVDSLITISSCTSFPLDDASLPVDDDDRSSLNAARRQRMLRELGCISYPGVDFHTNRDSDRSDRNLGQLNPPDHRNAYEQLEEQLEIERRLRAEAIKLAEAIKKAWEDAEAETRIEIEFRLQAERKAREEAEARLEFERKAREAAERRAEKMFDTLRCAHAEAINQAQAEMMARVQAEQEAITEKRAGASVEERARDESVALVGRKRRVLYRVFFHPRSRLPH